MKRGAALIQHQSREDLDQKNILVEVVKCSEEDVKEDIEWREMIQSWGWRKLSAYFQRKISDGLCLKELIQKGSWDTIQRIVRYHKSIMGYNMRIMDTTQRIVG